MHQFFLKHVEPLFSLFHHPLWCHNSASSKSLHIWCQLLIILMLVVCGCSDASSDQLNPISLLNDEAVVLAVCLFCKHNRVTPPPQWKMVGDDQVFSQQTFLLVKVGKSTAVADKMNNFSFLSKLSCDSEPACTARQQKRKQWNWIQLSLILLMCFYCCDTCLQKKACCIHQWLFFKFTSWGASEYWGRFKYTFPVAGWSYFCLNCIRRSPWI